MNKKLTLPEDMELLRARVRNALGNVRQASPRHMPYNVYAFSGERLYRAGELPEYYLVFFVLKELLGFADLGQDEKVAWSFPVELRETLYHIEYRKMGLGIFSHSGSRGDAAEIARALFSAVKAARPWFAWRAAGAVAASKLNVTNHCASLYRRYDYLLRLYRKACAGMLRAQRRPARVADDDISHTFTEAMKQLARAQRFRQRANWLALSAIEAFFSWTEHLFVHLAIVAQGCGRGEEVASLAEADWQDKFNRALDTRQPDIKLFYDELICIRRQLRNVIAHGAFGKNREAFSFHSQTGAVPVNLPLYGKPGKYSLSGELAFDEDEVISLIERFITCLQNSIYAPAMFYLLESGLPTILTHASDGTYAHAMQSMAKMKVLVEHLTEKFDRAANMDW
ncbi:hypothetical protein J0B02_11375 [Enterobacteriaceae bacterium YMB-R22]|uniref:hypothetical protein n=1 Tax=Tenebrionicola larvae TaxID=2815733 RepID=UPI0020125518|nr:hypothetical protein [Tenebrionicola larvae]MBV4413415.1 hypothetical protein [Tenebrionicola larvae]